MHQTLFQMSAGAIALDKLNARVHVALGMTQPSGGRPYADDEVITTDHTDQAADKCAY